MSATSLISRSVCRLAAAGLRGRCPPASSRVLCGPSNSFMSLHRRALPVAVLNRDLHFSLLSTNSDSTSVTNVRSPDDELVPERLYSRVVVKVKGADFRVLESYCRFVITAAKHLDISIGSRIALPTRIQKFTVLKSSHIFKKHRVQYEIRTHMRVMQIHKITGTTSDIFLEYIQRNLPEGVAMSVYQERIDTLPQLLTSPPEGEELKTPPIKRSKPIPGYKKKQNKK